MREVILISNTGGEDWLGWMGTMTADDHALTPGLQEAPSVLGSYARLRARLGERKVEGVLG